MERGTSEERGRARAPGGSKRDEEVSREMRESDLREEEERGRSRSRIRGGRERGESKAGKAVKEVVEAAAAGVGGGDKDKDKEKVQKGGKPAAGEVISASVDDETAGSDSPAPITSPTNLPSSANKDVAEESTSTSAVASPMFVPSSHALVSIPESEELSLPPSERETPDVSGQSSRSQSRGRGENGSGAKMANGESDDEEEEGEWCRLVRW